MSIQQLVTHHLEYVSYELLEKYPQLVGKFIHREAGIYALYRRGKLYYVGLASGLRSRLKQHLRDRHGNRWDRFSLFLTVSDDHMKELESLLLRIVQPSGNKVRGKFARSTDLSREIRRRIKEEDDRKLARLMGARVVVRNPGTDALKGRFDRRVRLRGHVNGKTIKASLHTNGRIRVGALVYDSPSAAASALGSPRNGWLFWSYKDPKTGAWKQLRTLRRSRRKRTRVASAERTA